MNRPLSIPAIILLTRDPFCGNNTAILHLIALGYTLSLVYPVVDLGLSMLNG
ncbi:MAG TPA: hypothetical protein VKR53_11500 [Puia sp.]|nr:hypothetical protein [Puia sp.]